MSNFIWTLSLVFLHGHFVAWRRSRGSIGRVWRRSGSRRAESVGEAKPPGLPPGGGGGRLRRRGCGEPGGTRGCPRRRRCRAPAAAILSWKRSCGVPSIFIRLLLLLLLLLLPSPSACPAQVVVADEAVESVPASVDEGSSAGKGARGAAVARKLKSRKLELDSIKLFIGMNNECFAVLSVSTALAFTCLELSPEYES